MRAPAGCRTAQCHGESWLTDCFAGLSPNACPDMVLGYPFLENSVPHFGPSVVERPGKMCPVPPPNGCSQSRQGFSRFSAAPYSPSLPIPPALRGSRSKGRRALPGALIQGTRAVTNKCQVFLNFAMSTLLFPVCFPEP